MLLSARFSSARAALLLGRRAVPQQSFRRVRCLSAVPEPAPSSGQQALAWLGFLRRTLTVENVRANWRQIAVGTGGAVVAYAVSSAAVHVATTLLELDFKQVFYFGFMSGLASLGAVAVAAVRAQRASTIRADAAFRAALLTLQRNSAVADELGAPLRSGPLRAFRVHEAHFAVEKFGWVEPRVQFIFEVSGARGKGMATGEVVKHKGALQFSLLAVDALDSKRLLLVAGKEERLHVKGNFRGFLLTERAKHTEMDRVLSDVDRLQEQKELQVEGGIKEEDVVKLKMK